MPIGVGDRVDAEKAVLAALGAKLGCTAEQPLAGEAAVDYDMRDMDAERAVFARHALRDRAQIAVGVVWGSSVIGGSLEEGVSGRRPEGSWPPLRCAATGRATSRR
jgi:hypothetical protein